MTDKEKIEYLINKYIKSCDYSTIEDMPEWVCRYLVSNSIKSFIYPLLEDDLLKINELVPIESRFEILDL